MSTQGRNPDDDEAATIMATLHSMNKRKIDEVSQTTFTNESYSIDGMQSPTKKQTLYDHWEIVASPKPPSVSGSDESMMENNSASKDVDKYEDDKSNDEMLDPTGLVFAPRVLKPAPYFYYTDHSLEPDDDPLTPLTMAGRVPTFPAKMHAILANKKLNDIVAWAPHGRSWCILNPRQFEIYILPKYFEHSKFSSFVRQANGWGFRRLSQGQDRNAYFHEYFLRGMPWLCKKMRRPKVSEKKALNPDHEPDFIAISREFPVVDRPVGNEMMIVQGIMELGPRARMPVHWGSTSNPPPLHPMFSVSNSLSLYADVASSNLINMPGKVDNNSSFNNASFNVSMCASEPATRNEISVPINGSGDVASMNDSLMALQSRANYGDLKQNSDLSAANNWISGAGDANGLVTSFSHNYNPKAVHDQITNNFNGQSNRSSTGDCSSFFALSKTYGDLEPVPLPNIPNSNGSDHQASRKGSTTISFSDGCWDPEPIANSYARRRASRKSSTLISFSDSVWDPEPFDLPSAHDIIGLEANTTEYSQQPPSYWDPQTVDTTNNNIAVYDDTTMANTTPTLDGNNRFTNSSSHNGDTQSFNNFEGPFGTSNLSSEASQFKAGFMAATKLHSDQLQSFLGQALLSGYQLNPEVKDDIKSFHSGIDTNGYSASLSNCKNQSNCFSNALSIGTMDGAMMQTADMSGFHTVNNFSCNYSHNSSLY